MQGHKMIKQPIFCDSGLGLLSGCPSTTDKWFKSTFLSKKKKKRKTKKRKTRKKKKKRQKKSPVQICIFPEGSRLHLQVLYVHIAL